MSLSWTARDGDELLVWTPADSWKVKRVRRDPRVTLAPCSRLGKVSPGRAHVAGTAVVASDAETVSRAEAMIRRKYGLGFRIVTVIETLAALGRRKDRVALVILLDDA